MSSDPTSPYPDFPFIPKKKPPQTSRADDRAAANPPPVEPERPMLKRSSSAGASAGSSKPVSQPAERLSRPAAGDGGKPDAQPSSSASTSGRGSRSSSRGSAPPPATVQVSPKKKPVKDPDEFDDDLFADLEPEATVRSRPTLRRKKKVTEVTKRTFEYKGEGFFAEFLKHPTEVAMPATSFFISLGIVIAVVSFNSNAIFGGIGEKAGAAITLGLTMALVAFNVVFSIIGLYIAAALFGFGYGALATAPLKMASIVTTRLAVELVFLSFGVPGLGIVSWGIESLFVYSMFITYFDLDFHEVGPSLFVIGVVRFLAFIAVGAIAIALIMGGKVSLDDLQDGGADEVIEGGVGGEEGNIEAPEFEVDPVTGQMVPVHKNPAADAENGANGQPGGEQPAGQFDPGGAEDFGDG